MKATSNRLFAIIAAGVFALGISATWGAKAPISAENRKKEASNIVTGEVVSVTSKIQKSTIEKAKGIHRDKIFSIKVKVEKIAKGKGIKKGDEILVVAWKAHTRIPPLPGLQGHGSIPKEGDAATFYLKGIRKLFEPLMPNGIDIDNQAKKKVEQDGADQPATAGESKAEGEEKPKTESDGRSQ